MDIDEAAAPPRVRQISSATAARILGVTERTVSRKARNAVVEQAKNPDIPLDRSRWLLPNVVETGGRPIYGFDEPDVHTYKAGPTADRLAAYSEPREPQVDATPEAA